MAGKLKKILFGKPAATNWIREGGEVANYKINVVTKSHFHRTAAKTNQFTKTEIKHKKHQTRHIFVTSSFDSFCYNEKEVDRYESLYA
jgi:hypothetical protein